MPTYQNTVVYTLPDGNTVSPGIRFTVNEFDAQSNTWIPKARYPHDFLSRASNADIEAIGITISVEQVEIPDPPAPTKEELWAYAADKRYQVESGGANVYGTVIKTDRESQAKLTAAYIKAQQNSSYTISDWKLDDNMWISLNANTIIALGDGVADFVQQCFSAEKTISDAIAANTITTFDEIETANTWPSNS